MGGVPPSLSFFMRLLCLTALWSGPHAQELRSTRWPLYSQKPFLLAWNAPTEDCGPRYGIRLQLDQFQIVASPNEGFVRQNLTIFYKERLGLYPYYKQDGTPVNGGLPQLASLEEHLDKMQRGIDRYIRESAKGLAVLDWEEWRPLWIRNWDAKDIYREKSRQLISEKNPGWSLDHVAKVAQQDFELSARRFMLQTLRQAKNLRPQQLWGFYLFPDCYNHNYRGNQDNYTGRCPDVEMTRNDQLMWLWTESTALYPSIYMSRMLKDETSRRQFVRNRVREGMRLASVGNGTTRPVFVYTRPTYSNGVEPLTEVDLISTIGESVSLGAAGVIFWGDSNYASSNVICSSLSSYLRESLGRYLLNVSSAAEQCSRFLCDYHGRCLRRRPDTDTYLHLSAATHRLELQGGRLVVRGQMGPEEQDRLREDFQCQCYTGYTGPGCSQKESRNGAESARTAHHTSLQGALVLILTLVLGFLQ
ncbi:hypothetical protein AOLI_G00252760 [Acnodon oligacanthus]